MNLIKILIFMIEKFDVGFKEDSIKNSNLYSYLILVHAVGRFDGTH